MNEKRDLNLCVEKFNAQTALKQVNTLLHRLSMLSCSTLPELKANHEFKCKVRYDNGKAITDVWYHEWYNEIGRVKYKDGRFFLVTEDSWGKEFEIKSVTDILYIDFDDLAVCLEEIINKHNNTVDKQNRAIKRVLELCKAKDMILLT